MSDESDCSLARNHSQANNPDNGGIRHPDAIANQDTSDELIRLGCVLLRIVIALLEHSVTKAIGRRVALLANSTMIPETGWVNARGGAAAMDMTEGSFKNLAFRKNMPTFKPGDELLYRLSDLTKEFAPRHPVPETPVETTHGRCAKKTPRPPRGKRQGEK